MKRRRLFVAVVAVAIVEVAILSGCSGAPPEPMPVPSITASPSATADPTIIGPVRPVGQPTVLASGLNSPWSILRLPSGSTLISERNTAKVRELEADGNLRDVGVVPGVVPGGEGGLLGLALLDGPKKYLYTYFTAASDNRIVRFALHGGAGTYSFDAPLLILSGIAKAGNHDGGRIKFGPDGMLYATAGEAGVKPRSQDPNSLNGKILRMDPMGFVPADNPTPGSYIYTMGHRNPQGIAWDATGQMWEAELGQNAWDEFNKLVPGKNYGWPVVEGIGNNPAYVDPIQEWPTSDASPSGLAFTRDTFFLASLRGQRIWAIYVSPTGATSTPFFVGQYGRIRDVAAGPNGTLWFITNNTDGRGTPKPGDDKLYQVKLEVVPQG